MLETTYLGALTVKIFIFPADLNISLDKVGVKMLSFFVSSVNIFVDRHLLPFFPNMESKHRMKEKYLTTLLGENRLFQFGTPTVAVVSAWQLSCASKSPEVQAWVLVTG